MGLRELKKRQTRKNISDLATRLFVERGYDAVTTAEIAKLAQVSQPTLFNYFPTKEALVFDEDSAMEGALVAAVAGRPKGQGVLAALLAFGLANIDDVTSEHKSQFAEFMALIDNTPELSRYARQMWARHEQALGAIIRKEAKPKLSRVEAEALARFVLDAYHRTIAMPRPKAALKLLFAILAKGWHD